MTIDELTAVWIAQDRQPPYAIDQRALRSALQERSRKLRRTLWSNEVQSYWMGLWIAGFLAYLFWRGYPGPEAFDSRYFIALGAAAAALAYFVLFSIFCVGRRRLQPQLPDFASSLHERLDREIDYLNRQIASRTNGKRVLLHLTPPWSACIVIVWAMSIHDGEPFRPVNLLSFAAVTGGWVHMYFLQRRWVARELFPRLRVLEDLRRELGESTKDVPS